MSGTAKPEVTSAIEKLIQSINTSDPLRQQCMRYSDALHRAILSTGKHGINHTDLYRSCSPL